jgi:hypothetical protein
MTIFGGIKPSERWDLYDCEACEAAFKYRHRTRRLDPMKGA